MTPVVAIDCDGVLCNFTRAFCRITRRLFNQPTSAHYVPRDWEYSDILQPIELRAAFSAIKQEPNWWVTLSPYDDVIKVGNLCPRFHPVFVTTRCDSVGASVVDQTAWWIHDYIGLQYPQVIVTEEKGPVVAALRARWFVDDKPENLMSVRYHSPATRVVLHRQPWNHQHHQSFDSVGSVSEFVTKVMNHKE